MTNDPVNPVQEDVLEEIARRSSPRIFADRPVPREKLRKLFEAARWAASSNNEQPWRFLVATREEPEAWERLFSCLKEGNQSWAASAPVLLLSLASTRFARSGGPNKYAWHDTGQATAHLALEAVRLGLAVHQMGGILPDKAAELHEVPEGYDVVAAAALGYPGDPADLSEDLRAKAGRSRTRKPLEEIVFSGAFGEPADLEDREGATGG